MRVHMAEAEDLGPSIAVEDALTVIVVILVLRVVLFVPLMNVDKARLENAHKETFWEKIHTWIQGNSTVTGGPAGRAPGSAWQNEAFNQYEDAFEIGGKAVVIRDSPDRRFRFIEAADSNSNVLIIRHDLEKQIYYSMFIQKFSDVPSFRFGEIKWSPRERKWFTLNNRNEYNQTPEASEMENSYRAWVEKREKPRP